MAQTGTADGASRTRDVLERLVERFDAGVFDVGRRRARIRIEVEEHAVGVVHIEYGQARTAEIENGRADAVLSATADTWEAVEREGGLPAFRRGRIRIRQDLHLGGGFLAATAPAATSGGLRC